MQHIIVKDFGPIRDVSMDVTDIIVLNGVQSSGKSTIAKLIYMFKNLPITIFKSLAMENFKSTNFNKNIVVSLRLQLVSIFGTTKHFENFRIQYQYTKSKYIEITKDKRSGHAYVNFSKDLKKEIQQIAENFINESNNQKSNEFFQSDFLSMQFTKRELLKSLKANLKESFDEERDSIFIPASRSLLSSLSGELRDIDSYNFDYLMKEFVERVFYMRELFSSSLDEMVENKKKLTTEPIDFSRVELAQKLVYEILQGKYVFEHGEEKIILDKRHFVKIKFASSGQQEILWILNILYLLILDGSKNFLVFEEPEAHLYPSSQYETMKMIGLFLSNNLNQGIITTHSPYVMSALNNLLFASSIGLENSEKTEKVLNRYFWIKQEKISAYFVQDGKLTDMFDKEEGLIKTEYIDSVSESLNGDFEKLLDVEYES